MSGVGTPVISWPAPLTVTSRAWPPASVKRCTASTDDWYGTSMSLSPWMSSAGTGLDPIQAGSRSPETETTAQGRSAAGLVIAAPNAVMAPAEVPPMTIRFGSTPHCADAAPSQVTAVLASAIALLTIAVRTGSEAWSCPNGYQLPSR